MLSSSMSEARSLKGWSNSATLPWSITITLSQPIAVSSLCAIMMMVERLNSVKMFLKGNSQELLDQSRLGLLIHLTSWLVKNQYRRS